MIEKDTNGPLVSVCIQTYQHRPYIEEALDSILMQQVNFPIEILIGEDGSTDGTREICCTYADKYPDKIRLFLNNRDTVIYVNGKPTGRWNFMNNLRNAKGRYIAILPGDDFWSDPLKLQKQVEVLEGNPEIVAVHHWYEHCFENGLHGSKAAYDGYCEKTITNVKDIFQNRVRIKARTLMFRNIIDEKFFPDWFSKVQFGDVPFSFLLGKYGNFHFIDKVMAVYRITGNGVSKTGALEMRRPINIFRRFRDWITIWRYANRHYNYLYDKEAKATIRAFYRIAFVRSFYHLKSDLYKRLLTLIQ